MSHVAGDRKLIHRIRRLKGQVAAIERTVEAGDCVKTLQLLAACRGAMTALTAEVLESHLREHVLDADRRTPRAIREVVDVIRSYVR